MNSIKEEDIFYVYERNRNFYISCSTPNICESNCGCHYNQLIFPKSIGHIDFNRKLNNKMYIWSHETCIICMDKIELKSNAYLSDCGHCFHKKCITNYYHHVQMISNKNLTCPICRCNLGSPILNERYNYYHKDMNSLDTLEDFNIEMLHICESSTRDDNHYLGMNSNCGKCLYYRKNG
jgi:hypothetical protein|uniref:RING-type domain-containing protein n=1 Tax=viral metagenome TaxID=1070528 RepID=A0A6C0IR64_9ZZZZ